MMSTPKVVFCGGLIAVCITLSCYITVTVWTGPEFTGRGVQRDILLSNNQRQFLDQRSKVSGQCTEQRNFVFIKCMKCATETMGTVLRRFGYFRNLTFVTPVKTKLYLGWPFLMNKYDYRPSSRRFNIITEHSIYNRSIMKALMLSDTVYISIIREPFNHLKSSLNYWRILDIAEVKADDRAREYISNFEKYEAVYTSKEKHQPRYCIPDGFSLTKNLMSHCLGMPLGFPEGREDYTRDERRVQDYIEQLDRDFHLIMIVEYFHESLVLLKRTMCWNFFDILYKTINKKDYGYKEASAYQDLVPIHKNWSSVDYKLYDHFNRTFWVRVGEQGPDFFEEVSEFSRIQSEVTTFCDTGVPAVFSVNNSRWSSGFSMVREDCKMLWPDLLKRIQTRHDQEEKVLLEEEAKVLHPEPQALC